jgi:hypothetical protein
VGVVLLETHHWTMIDGMSLPTHDWSTVGLLQLQEIETPAKAGC